MARLRTPALARLLAPAVSVLLAGCATSITGTAVWPGAAVERVILTAADFPPGVQYERRGDDDGSTPEQADRYTMRSVPAGCANGMTQVITDAAKSGLGRESEYRVRYDGAHISIGVLTRPLDLDQVGTIADRCAEYRAYFGEDDSKGIAITTSRIDSPRADALAYRQTVGSGSSVYMYFENIGTMSVFGMVLPMGDDTIGVKATLPQTFLDVATKQADRVASA